MEVNYRCSNCSAQVKEEDNFCPSCGKPLEEVLPAAETEQLKPGDYDSNRTVVLEKYYDEVSAEIAKQALADQGISAIISKDDAGGMNPALQFAYRIRLLVLNRDLSRAKEILNIGEKKNSFDNFSADMFTGLRTVTYKVNNLQKGIEWYTRAFGTAPYYEEAGYAGFDIGGFELGLILEGESTQLKEEGHTAYWEVTDIDEVFKHLLLIGAQRMEDIKDVGGGIRAASAADPFGNIIGIIHIP